MLSGCQHASDRSATDLAIPPYSEVDFAIPDLATRDLAVIVDLAPAVDGSAVTDLSPDDSAPPVDAAVARPIACGNTQCRADQECVAGKCQFACTGVSVPGTYPDLPSALTALQHVGGTICLGAQPYLIGMGPYYGFTLDKSITLIGPSAAETALSVSLRLQESSTTSASFVAKGIYFGGGVDITTQQGASNSYSFIGCKLMGPAANGSWAFGLCTNGSTSLLIDGCDISGPVGRVGVSVNVCASSAPAMPSTVVIENSWLHDSSSAISSNAPYPMRVLGNTIANCQLGINGTSQASLLIANNIFDNDVTAFDADLSGQFGARHNNALFQITNPRPLQPGDVTADPQLDSSSTPPSLKPTSPCIGAGDPALGPDHDYWAATRAPGVNLGAVQ
jgi:hypothetical protein